MLPVCPSPSIGLWVYWFQCLLFSPRVPYLRDGVTPAGSRFVFDWNEGLVSPFGSGPLVAAGALFPGVPLCGCGFSGFLGSLHCAPLTVGPLPDSPALFCLLSAGCLLGLESSPSGEASASSCRSSWRRGAAGALAVYLP